jgi:hypothetical protein
MSRGRRDGARGNPKGRFLKELEDLIGVDPSNAVFFE